MNEDLFEDTPGERVGIVEGKTTRTETFELPNGASVVDVTDLVTGFKSRKMYDRHGRVQTCQNSRGYYSYYYYDGHGNVRYYSNNQGYWYAITYTLVGTLDSMDDPNGRWDLVCNSNIPIFYNPEKGIYRAGRSRRFGTLEEIKETVFDDVNDIPTDNLRELYEHEQMLAKRKNSIKTDGFLKKLFKLLTGNR